MPVKIKSVETGSPADQLGLQPGDQIVSINDQSIADVIDFRFYGSQETLAVRVRRDGDRTPSALPVGDIDRGPGRNAQPIEVVGMETDLGLRCEIGQRRRRLGRAGGLDAAA
jgi:NifB/MoaA-like Fe-S oxidoreductase